MRNKHIFKPGDKVACIDTDSSEGKLKTGKVYTVVDTKYNSDLGNLVRLKQWPLNWFFEHRFILNDELSKTNRIVVTQRADDWHVCFENNPKKWECAKTYTEALGKLMISHCKEFNISEIVIEKKVVELIARS